jgi:predicted MPP superfamily phosphohydrolase
MTATTSSESWITQGARWIGKTWARFSYARHIEPTWVELNEHPIFIRDLPVSFIGLKIAHLTDFHGGHHLCTHYLNHVIDLTLGQKPDVIALTGDFVHKGYQHVDHIADILARLKAPLGVFAVLGNHDFSVRNAWGFRRHRGLHQAVTDSLESAGIRVLRNETIPLKLGNEQLFLCGLDDLWSGECDPNSALTGWCERTPRLILAHNPQTIHLLSDHRFDLILSGHTHGGQVDWPGVGRIFLGRKARDLAAGLYSRGDGHIYVNKGVGFGLRFRFRVRPEVAIFTLHTPLLACG